MGFVGGKKWAFCWTAASGHMNGTWPGCDSGYSAKAARETKASRFGTEWNRCP